MQKELYDVVVVGAGIVGCSVSYHLARSGLKVALVDKGGAAGEASQAAAGMLAPLGDEPPDQEHPLQQLGIAALSTCFPSVQFLRSTTQQLRLL